MFFKNCAKIGLKRNYFLKDLKRPKMAKRQFIFLARCFKRPNGYLEIFKQKPALSGDMQKSLKPRILKYRE